MCSLFGPSLEEEVWSRGMWTSDVPHQLNGDPIQCTRSAFSARPLPQWLSLDRSLETCNTCDHGWLRSVGKEGCAWSVL